MSATGEVQRRILERVRKGDLAREGFGSRDVWRAGWSGLADQKRVVEALELLVELGHLEAWQEPTRGRVKTLYVVNPKSATSSEAALRHRGNSPHAHRKRTAKTA